MGSVGPKSQICVACFTTTSDPDHDGWHLFTDCDDEEHALCARCASHDRAAEQTPTSVTSVPYQLRR